MGDFNVDLLKTDSDNDCSNFYNSLSSHFTTHYTSIANINWQYFLQLFT